MSSYSVGYAPNNGGKSFSIMGILPDAGLLIQNTPCELENIIITTLTGTGTNRHVALFDSSVIVPPATLINFCLQINSSSGPSNQFMWSTDSPFTFINGLFIVVSTNHTTVTLAGSDTVQYAIRYRLI